MTQLDHIDLKVSVLADIVTRGNKVIMDTQVALLDNSHHKKLKESITKYNEAIQRMVDMGDYS